MLTAADQMVDGSADSSSGGTSLYTELAIWLIQNWNFENKDNLSVYLSRSHVNADVVGISENECSPYIEENGVAYFLVNVLNEAPASEELQNILKTILMKHKNGLVRVTDYIFENVPQQSIAAAQEYIHRVSNSTHVHPGIQLPNLTDSPSNRHLRMKQIEIVTQKLGLTTGSQERVLWIKTAKCSWPTESCISKEVECLTPTQITHRGFNMTVRRRPEPDPWTQTRRLATLALMNSLKTRTTPPNFLSGMIIRRYTARRQSGQQ